MKCNSVKKNLTYNIIYQILKIIIPLIVAPYVSRVLGTSGIGTYSYFYSVSSYFLMFAMLGLANYGVREIALCKNKEDKKRTFSEIYFMQILTSLISVLIYGLFCIIASNEYSLFFIVYVLSGLFDISWYFFGNENFKTTVMINSLVRIIATFLIFVTVRTKNDLYLYCIYMCLTFLIPSIVVWILGIKDFDCKTIKKDNMKNHFKNNLILFVPIIAISIYKTMDKIMLGLMVDYSNVGLYENAEKLISVPMGFITALGYVMIPKISNNIAENKSTTKYIPISMKYVAFISLPTIFGVFAISKFFIPIFYGNEFYQSYLILNVLIISILFLGWANIIRTQILIPYKMDKIYIKSVFLGAITNVILNLILINKYRAIGVSVATVVSEMVVCIYQTIKIKDNDLINIKENTKIYIKMLIPSLLMYFTVAFFDYGSLYRNLIFKTILCIISYLLLCIIINKKDLLTLVNEFKKNRRK